MVRRRCLLLFLVGLLLVLVAVKVGVERARRRYILSFLFLLSSCRILEA